MSLKSIGPTIVLCCSLLSPGFTYAEVTGQEPAPQDTAPKYKLTILESPSTSKRVKKGRVSAEAVVKVTDTNNIPIPGITVTFLLPRPAPVARLSVAERSPRWSPPTPRAWRAAALSPWRPVVR